jgi:hypothetical protein
VLPNLFIVGQPKAGTTSLAQQLAQHKDVFLPSIKEPHYMCHKEGKAWYYYKQPLVYNKSKYIVLYAGSKEAYRIDASVHYLRFESAAQEVKRLVPGAKIVILMREPISRIISHYLMDLRSGLVKQDLNTLIIENSVHKDEYIECSKIRDKIHVYHKLFGEGNVLLIDFEDYTKQNQHCLKSPIGDQ